MTESEPQHRPPISDPPPAPLDKLTLLLAFLALTFAVAVALTRESGRSLQMSSFALSSIALVVSLVSLAKIRRASRYRSSLLALLLAIAALVVGGLLFVVH
jgi:hypothetical protein